MSDYKTERQLAELQRSLDSGQMSQSEYEQDAKAIKVERAHALALEEERHRQRQEERADTRRKQQAEQLRREVDSARREEERKRTVKYRRGELKKNWRLRWRVWKRDHFRCRKCGATYEEGELTVDHIQPLSRGGTNDESNLQTLCRGCNSRKGPRWEPQPSAPRDSPESAEASRGLPRRDSR